MGFIFGPVLSRRLGFSLGIDLTPLKVCTLDCIYCQLGKTSLKTLERKEYLPLADILTELKKRLQQDIQIDYLTLSGSGEPTLNLKIGELLREIKKMTFLPIAVITNGTILFDRKIREELSLADLILPSLDASSEEVFQKINRPYPSLKIAQIVEGLKALREEFKGKIWLEIMLVKGVNDRKEELEGLKKAVEEINPHKVQLNTVVRPSAEKKARPLTLEELEEIKRFGGKEWEIICSLDRKKQRKEKDNPEEVLLAMGGRRPLTASEISHTLGLSPGEVGQLLEDLLRRKRIKRVIYQGEKYYQRLGLASSKDVIRK